MKDWSIPPNRCKYAQSFEREINIDGNRGTKFDCLCGMQPITHETRYYWKCCEENCPKMDEMEKIMYRRK